MKTNAVRILTPASTRPRMTGKGQRMESLIETYCQHHVSQLAVAKEQTGLLRRYFPPLHRYTLAEITPLIVTAWFHEIGKHSHAQANKSLSILRTMFERARDWKLFTGDNPAQHVQKYARNERERYVTEEEMPRLQWALSREPEDTQCFFLLCLLVGCRRGEALKMQWVDLNYTRRVWRKPLTKTKRTHLVPVPLALLERIMALPRINEYVFASSHGGHLSPTPIFNRWDAIRKAAGLPDVTIHDLRRTCCSWLAIHGENIAMISKGVLNHTTLANTGIYTRLNVNPVALALEDNSKRMLGMDHASVTEPAPSALPFTTSAPTDRPGRPMFDVKPANDLAEFHEQRDIEQFCQTIANAIRPQPIASTCSREEERDEWPG